MEIENNITNQQINNNEKLAYSTQNANEYRGIYCFTFKSDEYKKNLMKIGQFTMPNPWDINDNENKIAAQKRIKQQEGISEKVNGVEFELNWYYPAKFNDTKNVFTDKDFHKWLRKNLGDKINIKYRKNNRYSELFDLTANQSLNYFKNFINHEPPNNHDNIKTPFYIRQEQENGINKLTKFWKKCCSNPNQKKFFLFNAIMRFGKCITTYEFIRRNNDIKHILILSHRPDVFNSWEDDYNKYLYGFCEEKKYKIWNKNLKQSLNSFNNGLNNIIAFVSIQDLRGEEKIKWNEDENTNEQDIQEIVTRFKQNNKEIFDFQWDLVVVDEAHEGILTKLAARMFNNFTYNPKMYILLSGTPFNLKSHAEQIYDDIDKFNEANSFEYSFLDEQEQQKSFLEKNKKQYDYIKSLDEDFLEDEQKKLKYQYQYYQDIPELRILTITVTDPNMKNTFKNDYFGFNKFFELNDNNEFVDEQAIDIFLDNLCSDEQKFINYPYSKKCRNDTKCAMWMLPSVKVAKALKKKLQAHRFFKEYDIFDVTGEAYSSDDFSWLKKEVDTIDKKIIILSFRRLTTGVTLKGLSTIIFLNDTTSLISYYQTMFRVKNPYPLNWDKKKKIGLIFDFNTFRCLNNTYELANETSKNGQANDEQYNKIINYFNIHGVDDKSNVFNLTKISINKLTEQANKAIAAAAYDSGCLRISKFFDPHNYQRINKFINKLDGYSYSKNKNLDVNVIINNTTGKPILTSKKNLTPEEKDKLKKEKIEIHKIIGIFVRIPILMLGMYDKLHDLIFKQNVNNPDFNQMFNDNMINIDEWKSIMSPNKDETKCIEKKDFKELCKMAKPGIFLETFKRYLKEIEKIFSYASPLAREEQWIEFFKKIQNPNKETVFTPYDVIKLQYDKAEIDWPNAYKTKQKFLDIYSKESLYSYYAACRLYEQAIRNINLDNNKDKIQRIWNKIIYNQIYCCCQNGMFSTIAQKILGFEPKSKNICQIDLVNKLNNE